MADAYDLIVIGSGPGGYVAAIRASQLGMKAAIVEREHLGGICLNWGCIPTKALLRSAEILHYARNAEQYGLKIKGTPEADLPSVVSRSRAVSERLNGGVGFLMKKNGIDVIWGEAKITRAGEIQVSAPKKKPFGSRKPSAPKGSLGEGIYKAKNLIVATGARPRLLPGIEPDGKRIWTYFEALVPERIPRSMIVVGSGAIGIEFASFYRTLGVEVDVIELLPEILPTEDAEISTLARKSFEKAGIRFHLGAKLTGVERKRNGIAATLEGGKDGKKRLLEAEILLSAAGVQGNVEGLGLESLGVRIEKGCVSTDGRGRTNIDGIHAVGDVAGAPMLAHKAEHEGVICVESIAGVEGVHPLDRRRIPGCVYSHPQLASVGLSEAAAKEAGCEVRVGRFRFAANGKAIALGEDEGMIKTLFDAKTGRLLGAHLIGAEVTELIHGFVVAMNLETTEAELMHSIFPHPTLSEAMKESVLDAHGVSLNA